MRKHLLITIICVFLAGQMDWLSAQIPSVTIGNSCYTVVLNNITINGTNSYYIPVCPTTNFTFAADMTVTLLECNPQSSCIMIGYQATDMSTGYDDDWGLCVFSDGGGYKRYGTTTQHVEFQVRGPQVMDSVPLLLARLTQSCQVGSQEERNGWHLDESYSLHQFAVLLVGSPTLIVETSGNGGTNPPQPDDPWTQTGNSLTYTDGPVGIGTANPSPSFALSVNGSTRTKRVVVETGWADHVLAPGYPLPSLDSVRTYIDQNGHLPGIPSAAQIEAQGLDLGAIQRDMMAKIEELTLYLMEMQAENERLRKRLEVLEKGQSETGGGK